MTPKKDNSWLMPPRIKILEALGTIADKRIEISGNRAKVISSTSKSQILTVQEIHQNSPAQKNCKQFSVLRNRKISDMKEKTYAVTFDGKNSITCNDNGSYYKGYLGYPSIAFLMLKGILPFNEKLAEALKGIKWKELNEKFKDYSKVEQIIKIKIAREKVKQNQVDEFVSKVIEKLKELELKKLDF